MTVAPTASAAQLSQDAAAVFALVCSTWNGAGTSASCSNSEAATSMIAGAAVNLRKLRSLRSRADAPEYRHLAG